MTNRDQFFQSWLIGFLFCLGLTLGSLGLLMLQHLSGGQWGMVGRRVFEAGSRTLPLMALFFIPILFAMPTLFIWARPEVVPSDKILQFKAPYLNVPFFTVRAAIYFVFWMFCAFLLNKWSAAQDAGEDALERRQHGGFRTLSAPALLFLVLTITFAVDRLGDVARSALVLDDLRPDLRRRLRAVGARARRSRCSRLSDRRRRSPGG